jgi:hypothetical protein
VNYEFLVSLVALLRSCLENLSQYLFDTEIYTILMTLKWANGRVTLESCNHARSLTRDQERRI